MATDSRSGFDTRPDADLRDRPVGELLKQLADETTTLVRQELELAKSEMKEKGRTAGPGIGMVGAAGGLALLAASALTAFFILILDEVMPDWLAALIVAAVYGVVAFVLFQRGKERVEEAAPPIPEQTVDSVKEDVEWAKSQAKSAKK
jgi:uncharacterized membrane protein YqjE